MKVFEKLKVLDRDWNRLEPKELADRITALMQEALTPSERRAVEKRFFSFAFGSVREFQYAKRRILSVAQRILKQNSLKPLSELGSLAQRITRSRS